MTKSKNPVLLFCTLLSCFLISCINPLTKNQLNIINCLNIGDTLIFKAETGARDTMVISEKGTYIEKLNPIFGNTWYRPQNAFIKFYNTNRDTGQFYEMVHIRAGRTPSLPNEITLNMRTFYCFMSITNDSMGKPETEPIEVNGKVYNNYFIHSSYCPDCPTENDSCDIEKLYWSIEKGPLMYIDIKKQKWIRIK